MHISELDIHSVKAKINKREISVVEVVKSLSEKMQGDELGAFVSFDTDSALEIARKCDDNFELTKSQPLGGIPFAVKDNINVQNQPCTCSSAFLNQHYTSTYDATVIKKLRQAGGIPLGKTNLDEFAMGSSTENSALQKTKNPHDHERVPGGSSGGSAVAVAGNLALASLGSDTGGSIRQPASFCGCVGFKPTYGRISRFGLVAFASSLDQIGPMTKNVRDTALLFQNMCGNDPLDSTSLPTEESDFLSELDSESNFAKNYKIGLPKEYFSQNIAPEVRTSIENAIKKLSSHGFEFQEINLPHSDYLVSVYYIIATAEASTNLARFDGIRYGKRGKSSTDISGITEMYQENRSPGFGKEVKRRILLGTYVLSSGYYDAYYLKAQKTRTLIRRDFDDAFQKVDFVLTPTTPTTAFKFNEKDDPLAMYMSDTFTIAANLAGLPAISLPCGFAKLPNNSNKKLPVGVQLMAKSLDEKNVLKCSAVIEKIIGCTHRS